MNSKQCLEAILDMLNYEQVDECDKKGLLRTIKKDLEMLEIIKKHLIISGLSITCFISGNPNCKEDYEKRFEEIKRWLKSE